MPNYPGEQLLIVVLDLAKRTGPLVAFEGLELDELALDLLALFVDAHQQGWTVEYRAVNPGPGGDAGVEPPLRRILRVTQRPIDLSYRNMAVSHM